MRLAAKSNLEMGPIIAEIQNKTAAGYRFGEVGFSKYYFFYGTNSF
jgi:hypothetical protein